VKIVRDDKGATDDLSGDWAQNVQGELVQNVGRMVTNTPGRMDVNAFGGKSETIGASSEETIGNGPIPAVNAKLIKAMVGKIVLEALVNGGIDLNVGPGGSLGTISIGKLGDIIVQAGLTATDGITISSGFPGGAPISITTMGEAEFTGTKGVIIGSSTANVDVEAQGAINLAGTTEPAILGKKFSKLFEDHTHPSPNGPTGPLSPKFAPKISKTMAKKVFLA
jgi:hypothetical protein